MKRAVKASLIFLTSLVLLLALLALIIFGTERGTLWAWSLAENFLPDNLQAENLSGRLAGPLYLDGFNLSTAQLSIQLDHAELDWSPGKLLQSTAHIERLLVNGLHITRITSPTGSTATKASATLPAEVNLPLGLELENIEFNDFQYRASATAGPFTIEHIKLDTSYTDTHLAIKTLLASSPLFKIDAQAELDTRDNYPLAGKIRWQVHPAGYATIRGDSKIRGDSQRLSIETLLDAPYNTTAAIELQQPLNKLTAKIVLATESLSPGEIQPDWPENLFSATATGTYQAHKISIDELAIKPANMPGKLLSQGTINLSGSKPVFDLKTNWQQLQWPLTGQAKIHSPAGKLEITGTLENLAGDLLIRLDDEAEVTGQINRHDKHIQMALAWKNLTLPTADTELLLPTGKAGLRGTLDDYLIQVDTALNVPEHASGYIKATGRGSSNQMQLGSLDIKALDGELKGTAKLAWRPAIDVNLDLKGQNLNPGVLFSKWPGKLMPVIQVQATNKNGTWLFQTRQTRIKGTLRGYPINLTAQASLENKKLELSALQLKSGKSLLELNGTVDEQFNLAWRLDSNNLSEIWPDAQGMLHGTGDITGTPPYPEITASLQGQSISAGTLAAKTVKLKTQLDTRLQAPSTLQLTLDNGRYADTKITSIQFKAAGIAGKHTAQLVAKTSQGNLGLDIQGKLDNPLKDNRVWHGVLQRATYTHPGYAGWQLKKTVPILVSRKLSQINNACWVTSPAGKVCLQGEYAIDASSSLQLSELPLAYFKPLLAPDIQLQGSLNGTASLSKKRGAGLHGKAELLTSPGQALQLESLTARELDKAGSQHTPAPQTLLSFNTSKVNLTLDAKTINLNSEIRLQDDDHLLLDLTLPNNSKPLARRQITGQLQADLDDFSFIDALSYEIDNMQGQLQANLQLSGEPDKPQLSGLLELNNFSASLLQPGLTLENGHFTLTGNGQQGLALKAAVTSGEGQLKLDGTVNLLQEQYADINLTGDKVTVVDTPDAHVIATPELKLAMSDQQIKLSGRLIIPYADITPRKLPSSAVTVSSDQVIVKPGQENAQRALSRDLLADLYLILGEDVNVDSFGLKAKIAGAVRIQEQPGEPATGSGELKIMKGQYKAYGQDLTIEQGRVLFTGGPLSRPGLDVRAVRKPRENIEVGIQVRGNLKNPDFTLFSTPSMTQQVQLSYLIFGRPPNEASGAENSALSRAAMAIGLKGGDFLTKNIGKHFGIDDIGIETAPGSTGTDQAALMLGKYLSPKIYVSYGLGLFEPISTFKLEYFINHKWRFVTESSGIRTGGDIFYSIERGK